MNLNQLKNQTTKTIEIFDKQKQFLESTKRKVLFDAGIGSGKSLCGGLWLGMVVMKYPNTKWLMGARDGGQLREATDAEFYNALTIHYGLIDGVHFEKKKSPHITYDFCNGSKVIGVGAHNYESVFRGGNYSGGLADEVDFWKEDAYTAFLGRIRVFPELIRCVSSPKGFNHIYKDFYLNKDKNKEVINATTYDNPFLSDGYIESLKSSYSPKLFEQEVLGKRLNLKQGQVFSEFDRTKHIKDVKDKFNGSQVYFFTDYNIAHYCGVYLVYENDTLYVIGEEHLQFKKTKDMAMAVLSKYPSAIVVGDSAGNNKRDVSAEQTNYQIFKENGLAVLPFRNPLVESRVINAQSRFYHDRVILDKDCTNTIRDLELLGWKEDGKNLDKGDSTLSHASDALTYGIWHFMPINGRKKMTVYNY